MRVGEYCMREVVIAPRDMGIGDAARLMREQHVGTLVIAEGADEARRPVGIVTDRDLVLEVLAPGLDPTEVTIGDLPSRELAVARVDDDLMETLEQMRGLGVRRMPVVDGDGALIGILAADDLLGVVSELCQHLVKLVDREVALEVRQRR